MDRTCVFGLILLLLTVITAFFYQCYNSYLDKNYYQICDGKHDYYTKSYEVDSANQTINFVDIDGRKIVIYGSASIISPEKTSE